MTDELRCTVEALSRTYSSDDDAFIEQTEELWRSLRNAGVRMVDTDQSGTKGGTPGLDVVEVIVAGGTGLTALVGLASLWVRQRGHRAIRLTTRYRDGTEQSVEIDARNVSDETVLEFAKGVRGNSS